MKNILIVGSGFSGAVLAREIAENTNYNILVVDERSHIGGNCYTERDSRTNIMEHVYGPHIFNTSNKKVWDYIRKYGEFIPYTNRVKAVTSEGVLSLPINLLTINQLFGKKFNPREAEQYIKDIADNTIIDPKNFEEQALKFVGDKIYKTFFKDYTLKQWGCDPKQLPASILKRIPVRFNYDDNYYNSIYQGIPKNGFTDIFEKLFDHKNIELKLNVKYTKDWNDDFDYVFYSGPIDAYYDFQFGNLGYRTIFFEKEYFNGEDYQGNPVINYCRAEDPYTRIHEHKHFTPWEKFDNSFYLKEFSKETEKGDVPYYPKRLNNDLAIFDKYVSLATNETKVTFIGRLGTYRYLDMHHVIDESLILSEKFLTWKSSYEMFSKFSSL